MLVSVLLVGYRMDTGECLPSCLLPAVHSLSLSLWVPVSVFLVVYFLLYTLTLGLLGAGE